MQKKDMVIIALVVLIIYFYYQQNKKSIQPTEQEPTELKELKNQVQHYQTLYQKRVARDLNAETLNSDWESRYNQLENLNNQTNREKNELAKYQVLIEKKVEDLEKQLLNLAKQKIRGKKEAERLLTDLETNRKQDKERLSTIDKFLEEENKKFIQYRGKINEYKQIIIPRLKDKHANQIFALETENKRLKEDTQLWRTDKINQLTEQLGNQSQEHHEQLRKINLLFDPQSANYERIDFNGLYKLLQSIAERERERE